MKKQKNTGLDFIIDKLTNSIENVVTGDSFATDITLITSADLKTVIKKNSWQFDWKLEFKQPQCDVYKLTIVNNQSVIQGLISLEIKSDHVYMHLVGKSGDTDQANPVQTDHPKLTFDSCHKRVVHLC